MFAGREHEISRPEEAEWPSWSGYLQLAWSELRDDRFYGAMGGLGRIYFSALAIYAKRSGLTDSQFDAFLTFMRALDDEYVAHMAEKQKAENEKNKSK